MHKENCCRRLGWGCGFQVKTRLPPPKPNPTSYELVKAFMGPFKAGFYQTFAALFGASLKKQYDPTGDDALTERVILLVESGQL